MDNTPLKPDDVAKVRNVFLLNAAKYTERSLEKAAATPQDHIFEIVPPMFGRVARQLGEQPVTINKLQSMMGRNGSLPAKKRHKGTAHGVPGIFECSA